MNGYIQREFYNSDCLTAMRDYPNNHFDLAIVDPPYGIGKNWKKDKNSLFYKHESTYKNDAIPQKDYFDQLFRISKHQIIWGANYFWHYLKPTSNIIFWDKIINPLTQLKSAGELAWTSKTHLPAHIFKFSWNGCATSEPRYGFHPHEKPITLYRWLLKYYASHGDLILDTHVGSASSLIAFEMEGFNYVGFEIDKNYYDEAKKRLAIERRKAMPALNF